MKRLLMPHMLATMCGCVLIAAMVCSVPGQSPQPVMTKDKWLADIEYAVTQILKTHPNPFRRISKEELEASIARLKTELPNLNDDEITIRLMQIVASIRDGHTHLEPSGSTEGMWFPIRFYEFTDGLFITVIDKQHASLAGSKVLTIGDLSAEEALKRAETAFASDNQWGALDASCLLSWPVAINGLKISDNSDHLTMQLETPAHERASIAIPALRSKSSLDYRQYGEMFGPVETMVTAFKGRPSIQFINPEVNSDLPLHLRGRLAYWFTYLPKEQLLYFQFNSIHDKSRYTKETLADFLHRMFFFADIHPVDLFVLDLRYDSGGDGSLVDGIVHEFIKRDATFNRPGHLFTIVGRKTFSAAHHMAESMKEHTQTEFIGEPMGAAVNSSGDPDVAILPNSRMRLSISTNYYIEGNSKDQSWEEPVQFPARFSSAQYFGGQDPALEVLLDPSERADLIDVLREKGGAAATRLYQERKKKYGNLSWWQPFDRVKLNEAAYTLLKQDRKDDAIAGFLIVADRHPNLWEPWDSLAEGYMEAGRYPEAIAAYKKALEISPNNWNAGFEKTSIQKMEAELSKKPM
jgi:hypothetical protein